MNARLRAKAALIRSGKLPPVYPVFDLYDKKGTVAMAVGFWKPKVLMDPRAFGENQALRNYWLWHECGHVLLGHTRLLDAARWLGIIFFAAVGAIALVWTGTPWIMGVAAFVGAWLEAKVGLFTVHLRAHCETEADAVALSTMLPAHFATAVKTMFTVIPHRTGIGGMVDRAVYGATWQERIGRVGLVAP